MLVSKATKREPRGFTVTVHAAVVTMEAKLNAIGTAVLRTAPVEAFTGIVQRTIAASQVPCGMEF